MTYRPFRPIWLAGGAMVALAAISSAQAPSSDEFAQSIRPVLMQNCAACHNPAGAPSRTRALATKSRTS